jgi:hypothetical protein
MVMKASKPSFNTGRELPAESVPTEWKSFRRYITNQPKDGLSEQLNELSTNSMLQTVPKFERAGKGLPDYSSRNSVSGTLILANENDKNAIEESFGRS